MSRTSSVAIVVIAPFIIWADRVCHARPQNTGVGFLLAFLLWAAVLHGLFWTRRGG